MKERGSTGSTKSPATKALIKKIIGNGVREASGRSASPYSIKASNSIAKTDKAKEVAKKIANQRMNRR